MMPTCDDLLLRLGHRAASCRRFRWLPGMLPLDPSAKPPHWLPDQAGSFVGRRARVQDASPSLVASMCRGCVPAVGEPATLGCLVRLVREAWNDPELVAVPRTPWAPLPLPLPVLASDGALWSSPWWLPGDGWCTVGRLEAEPLVAALEVAQGCSPTRQLWPASRRSAP